MGRGARRWVALALQVLGLAAVIVAAWRVPAWGVVAAAGGIAATLGWTLRWRPGRLRRRGPPPLALREILDLLARARGARAGWAVGPADGALEVTQGEPASPDILRRGSAIAQLASVDGRAHVARDPEGTYVAVGDFPFGAGLLLAGHDHAAALTDAAAAELRRFVAGMRLVEAHAEGPHAQIVSRRLARVAGGAQTLEGIARAGVELAEQLADRGAALVLGGAADDLAGGETRVLVVSSAADRRLIGLTLTAEAPAARAIAAGVPIVSRRGEDVFGPGMPERRRNQRAGTAYPLVDGHVVIGALVLLGAPLDPEAPLIEHVGTLVAELGPRLAAARAVHDAEQRAIRDPLTGLCNRREFERALAEYRGEGSRPAPPAPPPATLIYVDLDHFKRLNDSLGHAAGDAALKHVAYLLEAAVRDGDMVARIGGEEFAVWLPRTQLAPGLEVAERIRESIAGSTWMWRSSPYIVTTSCGVAAYPEPIGDLINLRAAADAALYRAKQAGRNRVEKADPGR
jgi:diguanylate cyclase (GGDEF)-like protein